MADGHHEYHAACRLRNLKVRLSKMAGTVLKMDNDEVLRQNELNRNWDDFLKAAALMIAIDRRHAGVKSVFIFVSGRNLFPNKAADTLGEGGKEAFNRPLIFG